METRENTGWALTIDVRAPGGSISKSPGFSLRTALVHPGRHEVPGATAPGRHGVPLPESPYFSTAPSRRGLYPYNPLRTYKREHKLT